VFDDIEHFHNPKRRRGSVIKDVPTAAQPVPVTAMMMNLGYLVKARELSHWLHPSSRTFRSRLRPAGSGTSVSAAYKNQNP
jgi:hypothetical protein